MQKLRQLISNTGVLLSALPHAIADFYRKNRELLGRLLNALTIFAFTIGVLALITLVWLYVRPIPTANIKVPVATDQASYSPGEKVGGIFFGDTYYNGEVRVLREVYCKDYKGFIKPPADSAVGNFFSTQARPRHLEGTTVSIGNLPDDIPVGSNCVLQFTNVYEVQTPFGIRHIEYQYYTQNFSIVSVERRQQLDCEASGAKTCDFTNKGDESGTPALQQSQAVQSSPETAPSTTTNNSTTNNTTNNSTTTQQTAPAPHYQEQCTLNLGIIKGFCSQVLVQ